MKAVVGVVGVAVALSLAACDPVAPTPTATPSPTASTSACGGLLFAETVADFDSFGYVENTDFAQQMLDAGNPVAAFVEYGGLLCQWGVPDTGNAQNYGFSPITPENTAVQEARLVAAGLTVSAYDGGALYSEPTESLELNGEQFLFIDGYWLYGHNVARLDELLANAPVD